MSQRYVKVSMEQVAATYGSECDQSKPLQTCQLHSVSQKNNDILVFKNNSVKNEPILVIFGIWNPKEMSHQMIINISTNM